MCQSPSTQLQQGGILPRPCAHFVLLLLFKREVVNFYVQRSMPFLETTTSAKVFVNTNCRYIELYIVEGDHNEGTFIDMIEFLSSSIYIRENR